MGVVVVRFLEMCLCSLGTAAAYFEKVESVFNNKSIPWHNCIAFSVDNASVNVGRRNSIKTRLEEKNPAVYTLGCPCHFLHNGAHAAAKKLEGASGFDVEEICVDVFYYFDHSTKRKGELADFSHFCNTESRKMLKYVSTRWLSLQTSVERILKQYQPLCSYFLSQDENHSDRRLTRLQSVFNDPLTEAFLLFYQSVTPVFTELNLLLQRESPCIHLLRESMMSMLQKLLGRFVTVSAMESSSCVLTVLFEEKCNQLGDGEIMVGFVTRQVLVRVQDIVQPSRIKKFYSGVRAFFVGAASYIVRKFPWSDELLQHATFVDFSKRKVCSFESVRYFLSRFPQHLPSENADSIYDEFRLYQNLQAIPADISMPVSEGHYVQPDILWHGLEKIVDVNGMPMFAQLAKVAKLVLVLPHSNADEERIFSLVRKNKTSFRSNLSLDTTLPSILHCKVNGFSRTKCYEFSPSPSLLKDAKSATWQYNKKHMNS